MKLDLKLTVFVHILNPISGEEDKLILELKNTIAPISSIMKKVNKTIKSHGYKLKGKWYYNSGEDNSHVIYTCQAINSVGEITIDLTIMLQRQFELSKVIKLR